MAAKLGSVVEAQQFKREIIEEIFDVARGMEDVKTSDILRGKIMVTLFYEPSTRTYFSFQSAMKRLGGDVIGTENAKIFSSAVKGESLEDAVRVSSSYGDVIVLRYYKEGGAERAADHATVPVINAGDGTGQHPTQALLDLYTIQKEFGGISGLNIAMVGDLANGRTVHSLAYFLAKYFPDNKIIFISPPEVSMKEEIKAYLDKYDVLWQEEQSLNDVICDVDVLYQTRVQSERFKENPAVHQEVLMASKNLAVTLEITNCMKRDAIIMHPLPRNEEIQYVVDQDPRAKYFEQAENGLYVRMALLKMILT